MGVSLSGPRIEAKDHLGLRPETLRHSKPPELRHQGTSASSTGYVMEYHAALDRGSEIESPATPQTTDPHWSRQRQHFGQLSSH